MPDHLLAKRSQQEMETIGSSSVITGTLSRHTAGGPWTKLRLICDNFVVLIIGEGKSITV